jgi:hypothetical protein
MAAGGESETKWILNLSIGRYFLLLILLILAVSAPTIIYRLGYPNVGNEPVFIAVFSGFVVSTLCYFILRVLLKDELSIEHVSSTAVALGLISTHSSIFHVTKTFPKVEIYALFFFLFLYHLNEVDIKQIV